MFIRIVSIADVRAASGIAEYIIDRVYWGEKPNMMVLAGSLKLPMAVAKALHTLIGDQLNEFNRTAPERLHRIHLLIDEQDWYPNNPVLRYLFIHQYPQGCRCKVCEENGGMIWPEPIDKFGEHSSDS